jgi:hypothetical protein
MYGTVITVVSARWWGTLGGCEDAGAPHAQELLQELQSLVQLERHEHGCTHGPFWSALSLQIGRVSLELAFKEVAATGAWWAHNTPHVAPLWYFSRKSSV